MLLLLQVVGDEVKEVAGSLQELKASRVHPEQEELSPCDAAFSTEAERVSGACVELQQQVKKKKKPAKKRTCSK